MISVRGGLVEGTAYPEAESGKNGSEFSRSDMAIAVLASPAASPADKSPTHKSVSTSCDDLGDESSSSAGSNMETHLETHHAGLSNAGIIKSVVYGGIDGVITTFSIISSAYGANLSYGIILTLGIANVLADGFSMGFGDFISGKMEKSFVEAEREKELNEFRKKPKHEKKEMKELLMEKEKLSKNDAHVLVEIMAKYENLFIRNMMIYELDLAPWTDSWHQLVVNGAATFLSFILFGSMPLYVYLVGLAWPREDRNEDVIYAMSCVVSGLTLFTVGAASAKLTKQRDKLFSSGLFTLFNGTVAGTMSFFVGYVAENSISLSRRLEEAGWADGVHVRGVY